MPCDFQPARLMTGIPTAGIAWKSWLPWQMVSPCWLSQSALAGKRFTVSIAGTHSRPIDAGDRCSWVDCQPGGGICFRQSPAWRKSACSKNLNLQSAFLHVVGDAVSSVGVIAAAIIISLTGAQWVDPLASALIAVLILVSSFRVLKSSLHILVEGTPEGLSLMDVEREMREITGG